MHGKLSLEEESKQNIKYVVDFMVWDNLTRKLEWQKSWYGDLTGNGNLKCNASSPDGSMYCWRIYAHKDYHEAAIGITGECVIGRWIEKSRLNVCSLDKKVIEV